MKIEEPKPYKEVVYKKREKLFLDHSFKFPAIVLELDRLDERGNVVYYSQFEKGGVVFELGEHVYLGCCCCLFFFVFFCKLFLASPTDVPYCGKILQIFVDKTKPEKLVEVTINWYYRFVDIVEEGIKGRDPNPSKLSKGKD